MKNRTKWAAILLAAAMLLTLCACGETEKPVPNMIFSSGFEYEAAYDSETDQAGFAVTGLGTCADYSVVVPPDRENEAGETSPILWDDGEGFRGMKNTRKIQLPEGLLEIRAGFGNSPALETVIIPSTVRKIGATDEDRIFENCPALKEVIFGGTTDEWNAIEKGKNWKTGAVPFVVLCSNNMVSE